MICKYCGKQYAGNKCPSCGKSIPLVKRSLELDILMKDSPIQPFSARPNEKDIKEEYPGSIPESIQNEYEGSNKGPVAPPKSFRFETLRIVRLAALLFVLFLSGIFIAGIIRDSRIKKSDLPQDANQTVIAESTEEQTEENSESTEEQTEESLELTEGTVDAADQEVMENTPESITIPSNMFPYSQERYGWIIDTVVKRIQTRLNELGLIIDKELVPDGVYGPDTEEAVRKFQRVQRLPATGEVDIKTYKLLFPDDVISQEQSNFGVYHL